MDDAKAAKQEYQQELMGKENVVGVGVGYKVVGGETTDIPCVIVFVQRKVTAESLSAEQMVPADVQGVPTDVIESGPIFAHQSNTDKFRPAPGGVSIGHYQITAGTLGVVARDKSTGERLILSNNHVLANSNDASPGDPIIQPGSADGGTVADDQIGTLVRFQPIVFGGTPQPPGCNLAITYAAIGNFIARTLGSEHRVNAYQPQQEVNLVDAAVARPLVDEDILDDILEIGTITGTVEATPGMPVRKSGRTTELTTGTVTAVNTTVTVGYGAGRTAVFEQQIVSGAMSQPGDSGSLVVDGGSQLAVGLLFAGSSSTTIYSPIDLVQDLLNVTVGS
ncbi:MAG: hypothetical protein JSW55_09890 [Chloroflexota bacterium]|nr:MAG: hypothetical protein JSW55_09890 [Chloroflexota bacterium]